MDDETNDLLDRFLDVASGERTALTRARYAVALDRLRIPQADEDRAETASVRLILRIAPAIAQLEVDEQVEPDVRRTVPSLWERLVRWLARNTDAGGDDARCLVLEAYAALRLMGARALDTLQQSAQWGWREPLTQPNPYGIPYDHRFFDAPAGTGFDGPDGAPYDGAPYDLGYDGDDSDIIPLRPRWGH